MSGTRSAAQEAAWQAVREVVLSRDEHCCRDCGAPAARRHLDVHHLIRRADGGRDEVSNCITLCDGCHGGRHPRLQVALSRHMMNRWAVRLARWVDRSQQLPDEVRALSAGLKLFGVDRFREGQLDAVVGALHGDSLLVIRPTGGGKSLCFQLPAILKGQPTTFVLSPLKALMVDQVTGLQHRKLPATFINSDISREEKDRRYELLDSGALSFLYVAPERFNPQRVRPEEIARLVRHRPTFLVVDEAHLVDRWGEDFRVDYSRLAEIRRQLGDPPVLAFTATAGTRTQERIKASLGVPDARTLVSGVDRPNIALIRMREPSDSVRARIVAEVIDALPAGRAMVFVPTTRVGGKVQAALAAAGCQLPLYHSKLPADERDVILGRFTGALEPPLKAVICTSAFSMGLDVPDVRAVVNWQHPAAVEDYLQELGRGGRDGQPAISLLFTDGGRERGLLRWMAKRTAEQVVADGTRTPAQAQQTLRGRYERIEEMSRLSRQTSRCFRAALIEALTGPATKTKRSLAQRILDKQLVSHARICSADACCDVCNPDIVQRLRAGAYIPHVARARVMSAAHHRSSVRTPRRYERWRFRPGAAVRPLALLLAASAAAAIAVAALTGGPDTKAIARDAFDRYTASSTPGEFAPAWVASERGVLRACAKHRRDGRADRGRYTLCLLVDPSKPASKQVIGRFKTSPAGGRHDCHGAARHGWCN